MADEPLRIWDDVLDGRGVFLETGAGAEVGEGGGGEGEGECGARGCGKARCWRVPWRWRASAVGKENVRPVRGAETGEMGSWGLSEGWGL